MTKSFYRGATFILDFDQVASIGAALDDEGTQFGVIFKNNPAVQLLDGNYNRVELAYFAYLEDRDASRITSKEEFQHV